MKAKLPAAGAEVVKIKMILIIVIMPVIIGLSSPSSFCTAVETDVETDQ